MIDLDLMELCKKDFGYFCECVLGQKVGGMHKEWIRRILFDPKHLCLVAARGHWKTTILSVYFPLWIMFKSPQATANNEAFVIIESATLDQSTEVMRRIKNQIEMNPVLIEHLLPTNIYSTKWSETEVKCKNGNRIKCVPFGDAVRGKHPNYCIVDDPLTSESTNIEYAKTTYYSAVFPIGQGKGAKHIVVGTPQSFTDLLADLETKTTFTTLKYPAVISNDAGEWVAPQLPEAFTLEKLREVRDTMPAHLWAREYMVTPISDAASMFPYDTSIKPAIDMYYDALSKEEKDQEMFFLGCDVALSSSATADFAVQAVISKVPGRPLRLVELRRQRGLSSPEQEMRIKEMHSQYHFTKILIEQTGLGFALAEAITKADATKMSAEAFDTKRAKKEQLLSNLELLLRNKGLKLLQNDVLVQELTSFGIKPGRDGKYSYEGLGAHDDTVIALALACFAATEAGSVDLYGLEERKIAPFHSDHSEGARSLAPPPDSPSDNVIFVG